MCFLSAVFGAVCVCMYVCYMLYAICAKRERERGRERDKGLLDIPILEVTYLLTLARLDLCTVLYCTVTIRGFFFCAVAGRQRRR